MYFLRGELDEVGGFGTRNTSEIGVREPVRDGWKRAGEDGSGPVGAGSSGRGRQGGRSGEGREVRDRGAGRPCGGPRGSLAGNHEHHFMHPGRDPRLPGVRLPLRADWHRREAPMIREAVGSPLPALSEGSRTRSPESALLERLAGGPGGGGEAAARTRAAHWKGRRTGGPSAGNRAGGHQGTSSETVPGVQQGHADGNARCHLPPSRADFHCKMERGCVSRMECANTETVEHRSSGQSPPVPVLRQSQLGKQGARSKEQGGVCPHLRRSGVPMITAPVATRSAVPWAGSAARGRGGPCQHQHPCRRAWTRIRPAGTRNGEDGCMSGDANGHRYNPVAPGFSATTGEVPWAGMHSGGS
jgi:hypothetical protein